MVPLPTLKAKTEVLEIAITEALRDGFAATFGGTPTDTTYKMSVMFAQAAAPKIASAIETYISTMVVSVPAVPVVTDPITGTGVLTIPDPMFTVG